NYASWQVNGNSYPINIYWEMYFYTNGQCPGPFSLDTPTMQYMPSRGKKMLKRKIGGPASPFAMFYEEAVNEFMFDARPDGSSVLPRIRGWHRKFSNYTVGFLDGSANHMFLDTKRTIDVESVRWTTWPEPKTVSPDMWYPG